MSNTIKIITKEDEEYPEQLKAIKKSPEKLYVKGNIALLKKKSIAIVGSRRCTENGRKIAKQIAYELAENGMTVVSGLALRHRYRGAFRSNEYSGKDNSRFREWYRKCISRREYRLI